MEVFWQQGKSIPMAGENNLRRRKRICSAYRQAEIAAALGPLVISKVNGVGQIVRI